ncbi:MAG: sarcosine oxidase subunit gamma family protein, partial [Rhodobacter sp.]|nr:sarcosine oxidase subunit gamma family protein [Rhodobacter sp.]
MADIVLTPAPPLGGYDETRGGLRLRELTGLAVVSLAIPLGEDAKAAQAIKSAFRLDLPDPGTSTANASHRLIRTGPDQLLLAFEHATPDAEPVVAKAIKGALYTTDQTGAWVTLELSGAGCRAALERLCPLDLHPDTFPVGAAHRTFMAHFGVVIMRSGEETFLQMSS